MLVWRLIGFALLFLLKQICLLVERVVSIGAETSTHKMVVSTTLMAGQVVTLNFLLAISQSNKV